MIGWSRSGASSVMMSTLIRHRYSPGQGCVGRSPFLLLVRGRLLGLGLPQVLDRICCMIGLSPVDGIVPPLCPSGGTVPNRCVIPCATPFLTIPGTLVWRQKAPLYNIPFPNFTATIYGLSLTTHIALDVMMVVSWRIWLIHLRDVIAEYREN